MMSPAPRPTGPWVSRSNARIGSGRSFIEVKRYIVAALTRISIISASLVAHVES